MLHHRLLLLRPVTCSAMLLLTALGLGAAAARAGNAERLRINGSTTVNPVVSEAAAILRREQGLEITVDTLGGSSGGIHALGSGGAEVAMSSRPLTDSDRGRYPAADFRPVAIAADALALVVSKDVWAGGVTALSRQEVRRLYEGEITNWSQLGGPDQRVAFFNKEPGRGTWEVFATWLYGDAAEAPRVRLPEVGSNEEGRTKVRSTRGAITQLSAAWANGIDVFALALDTGSGAIAPSVSEVSDQRYPLVRPLLVVTDGPPAGAARQLVDFLLSPRGQELVRKAGYLPIGTSKPALSTTEVGGDPRASG